MGVAGFSLVSQQQCRTWLNENLRLRVWVGTGTLESWHAENRPVLDRIGSRELVSPLDLAMATDIGEEELVPFVEAIEMAELFALAWQRARVASPFFFLANSEHYAALRDHHALRFAHEANAHALERVTEWLATWFAARGLTVDETRCLINLPGYRALFYRAPATL
ncbi:hypothetical protein OKW30_008004 [Paraburkholderia sp. Clong3]|uniref:hypothetical protein n=1 Tax=Paraburkholderia sp. Clong3 TaxID=2991061 RepID=UPI003D21744E